MSEKTNFCDDFLKEEIETLLDEDNQIKKWNEGLFIKSLILLPMIIFIIGLFIMNRPENLLDVLFIFIYPLVLILIGLLLLFLMRSKAN